MEVASAKSFERVFLIPKTNRLQALDSMKLDRTLLLSLTSCLESIYLQWVILGEFLNEFSEMPRLWNITFTCTLQNVSWEICILYNFRLTNVTSAVTLLELIISRLYETKYPTFENLDAEKHIIVHKLVRCTKENSFKINWKW